MKRVLSLLALVFGLGLATIAMDADAAKRIGSGKSLGTQRQTTPNKAPAAATPAPAATPAAAASPSRSWLGPVAGLAAGLGLAALASHLGLGDALASMLAMGLLAAAVMLAIGLVMRKRAAGQQATPAGTGGLQYAHVGAGTALQASGAGRDAPVFRGAMPVAGGGTMGSGIGSGIAAHNSAGRIPADFDTAGFERNAKLNFIRLQAAHDAGDLNDLRQFTTPEMFAELKVEVAERGASVRKTDVVDIRAEVTEVDVDADRYLVSVRFTGVLREGSGEPDESFDELWHLTKSRQGHSGWVLAGIQQLP